MLHLTWQTIIYKNATYSVKSISEDMIFIKERHYKILLNDKVGIVLNELLKGSNEWSA